MFCAFRNPERLAKMLGYAMIMVLAHAHFTDAACSFPTNLHNKNMTSTNFGTMLFQASSVNFTIIASGKTLNLWTCHVTSGTKYVLQSESLVISSSLHLAVYIYYCLDIREQSADSYLYYLQSDELNSRLQTVASNVTVDEACNTTKNIADYNVMINSANKTSVKNYCASPLLGNFYYTCSSKNGTLNVCTNSSSQKTLIFNHTQCTGNPLYSVSGKLNCVATTSTTISSQDVFYQTLYNTDSTTNGLTTFPFVCVAASDINGTVYMSYSPTVCTSGQTAKSGGTNFQPLNATETCPLPVVETPAVAVENNLGLIVGLAAGLGAAALIAAALITYFCCFFKRDPNAGKPIVENTKPRFEDPDKDDIIEDLELDVRSTPVTRDEITFEAISPTLIPNGKIQNGHPVSMSRSPTGAGTHNHTYNHAGSWPNGVLNGSVRRDSGIGTSKSIDRPTPRIGLNPTRESMVIFNGDEKVISGNDTRIVPNSNPESRAFRMDNSMTGGGVLTLEGLETEEMDELGELSPRSLKDLPYPSLPREKSNLMPPIETNDPEKDKEA